MLFARLGQVIAVVAILPGIAMVAIGPSRI